MIRFLFPGALIVRHKSSKLSKVMYFEIQGSTVRLAGTMHRVPEGRRLAHWVHDAIDAARLIYIEHEEGASTQGQLATPWAARLAQRLVRSWPRIERKFPRATTLQLNWLSPRMLVSCLLEQCTLDCGVEHLALSRSRETHAPRPRIEYLETAAQLHTLDGHVSDAEWDEAVYWILDNPASATTLLQWSYDAWTVGDFEAIDLLSSTQSINRFAPIKEANINARNQLWLPIIGELVRTASEPILVLVGSAHLGGPDGLVSQLVADGNSLKSLI